VATGYAARQQAQPQRFARIDAARSRDEVWGEVLAAARGRGLVP
jgi:dTMP kinase